MKILIKYPTRNRFSIFQNTLNKYYNFLSGIHDVKFIITCDNDDKVMNNKESISFMESKPNLKYFFW